MFTAEERDRIREQLLARAETDSAVVGAAFTGSHATGDGGRWWQAEHWISAMRDHVITLACVRLGYPAHYAKGAHLLPEDLTTPSVVESAVVGVPHERWGEVPVAFVMLRKDDVDADALTEYARERLARYKVPKRYEFCELPKTSTGKIQKNVLRDRAHEL
jgi:acyl-CoA synthetase (AMP-forming)/AMP-acid ligase II